MRVLDLLVRVSKRRYQRAAPVTPSSSAAVGMAWRARVGCVLLAPCLVAARPMAQSNAPVPLSHELSRTRRALTGYVMDDDNIRTVSYTHLTLPTIYSV